MPYRTIDSMNWRPKDDAVIPRWVTIKNCACCTSQNKNKNKQTDKNNKQKQHTHTHPHTHTHTHTHPHTPPQHLQHVTVTNKQTKNKKQTKQNKTKNKNTYIHTDKRSLIKLGSMYYVLCFETQLCQSETKNNHRICCSKQLQESHIWLIVIENANPVIKSYYSTAYMKQQATMAFRMLEERLSYFSLIFLLLLWLCNWILHVIYILAEALYFVNIQKTNTVARFTYIRYSFIKLISLYF